MKQAHFKLYIQKTTFTICFIISFTLPNLAQNKIDTIRNVIVIGNNPIQDCHFTKNYGWILREDGKIIRIDKDKLIIIDSLRYLKKIVAIGKSNSDTIYAADESGDIFKIYDNSDTSLLWSTGQHIQSFVFTSEGRCFLITDKGIFYPDRNRLYYENAHSNGFISRFNMYKWHPTSIFIDTNDNIWLGFSGGEWGGDIIIFSTRKLGFIIFRERQKEFCYVSPVRSFFQIDSIIYATTSLQHMRVLHSSIIKITDTCSYYFKSPSGDDGSKNLYKEQELYLGPALFNPIDSSIYFYCQFGVFKGDIRKDLTLLENWSNLFETKLLWYYGMPDAVGYSMNVTKMLFEGNKLVVVSPNNGIVVWDGNQKILLKTTYKPED